MSAIVAGMARSYRARKKRAARRPPLVLRVLIDQKL
jgi:hypothetical protein